MSRNALLRGLRKKSGHSRGGSSYCALRADAWNRSMCSFGALSSVPADTVDHVVALPCERPARKSSATTARRDIFRLPSCHRMHSTSIRSSICGRGSSPRLGQFLPQHPGELAVMAHNNFTPPSSNLPLSPCTVHRSSWQFNVTAIGHSQQMKYCGSS